MKFFRSLAADLGDKRLWPVVIVLGVLALAVPIGVALTTGSTSPPLISAPPPLPTQPVGLPAPAQALQSVAGPGTPAAVHYRGVERDPFRAAVGAVSTAATAATTAAGVSSATTATRVTSTAASAGTTASPTTTTKTTATTTSPAKTTVPSQQLLSPTSVSVPTIPNLSSTDSYVVDIAIKDATGLHAYRNIERLSLLPASSMPAMIFLGVLKGGQKAVFLNTGHTTSSGPSTCVPTKANCQIVELRPGFGIHIKLTDPSLGGPTFDFVVKAIAVERHKTTARARRARKLEYVPGRQLLRLVNTASLLNFQYTSAHGYIVETATTAAARAMAAAAAKLAPVAIVDTAIAGL